MPKKNPNMHYLMTLGIIDHRAREMVLLYDTIK